ncbi:MAG: Rne/Rng family ribonuclease, partial [Candidatus Micropelagos thuwalensis]|nr:Rne/Rng family ribonuclease [Candidatus Micropelagos thuwalensis]
SATDSNNNEDSEDDSGDTPSMDVEDIGGDAHEEASRSRSLRELSRKYKIQEVIKRRQVILVQAVKEERGNKGAALTTYLSLAGRYCVLMPNTAKGGGVSRKINNINDRKKLKKITEKLDVPQGMGLIIRTAGAQRTAVEIKRDFEYLMRMWKNIRELTLESSAPSLVYEEGSLIKRSIRDLYHKDFEEILIDGEDSYKNAKEYMKLLMPSHARKIKLFKKDEALFQETGIEDQLSAMFNPVVPLPSGGYLVINPTEALVSVDVNSGRSTKEHSVEKTALKTNLEAATEIARQMRLRDLAGLLVIDFIDMDENRNNRAVERRIKDALKKDRARIQVGKISPFGLLEMSRQRMRSGVLEGSSEHCSHCNGTGMVRSIESRALHVLRRIEQEAVILKDQNDKTIEVKVPREVAEYILNYKRTHLVTIESNSGCFIVISSDEALNAMEMSISSAITRNATQIRMDGNPEITPGGEEEPSGRKRRRRGKRGSGDGSNDNARDNSEDNQQETGSEDEASSEADEKPSERADGIEDDEDKPRRRRRGRRGGRRRRKASSEYDENNQAYGDTVNIGEARAYDNTSENVSASELPPAPPFEFSQNDDINDGLVITSPAPMNPEESPAEADVDAAAEDKPAKKPRRAPRKKKQEDNVDATSSETSAPEETPKPKTVAKKPRRSPRKKASTKEGTSAPETSSAQEPPVEVIASENIETKSEGIDANDGEKRSGWWRR